MLNLGQGASKNKSPFVFFDNLHIKSTIFGRYLPTTKIYTENELVEKLVNKDKTVIDIIYQMYSGALLGAIFRIVNNKEVAEDVLQEAFIKIWKYGEKFDASKGRLFTWMLNICKNAALDCIKSAAFKNNQNQSIPLFDNENEADNRFGSSEQNIETIGMTEVINKLENDHKKIVNLIYIKGYTQAETAEMLGLPLGTIKSRSRSAINKLRLIFER